MKETTKNYISLLCWSTLLCAVSSIIYIVLVVSCSIPVLDKLLECLDAPNQWSNDQMNKSHPQNVDHIQSSIPEHRPGSIKTIMWLINHFSDMFKYIFWRLRFTPQTVCVFGPQKSQPDLSGSWLTSQPGLIWDGAISSFGSLAGGGIWWYQVKKCPEVPSSRVATDTKKQSMSLAELGHVLSESISFGLCISSLCSLFQVQWCILYNV